MEYRIKRLGRCTAALLLAMILLTSSFAGFFSGAVNASAEEKKTPEQLFQEKLQSAKELKDEYEQKKEEAEELIARYNQELESISQYIMELDLEMNDLSLQIIDLRDRIALTEEELAQTLVDLDEARKKEAEQYETMKKRIQYMYENGESSMAEVLLGSDSLEDLLNQVEYASSITKYDNALLDRYIAAKNDVIAREALLEASLDELTQMKANCELEQQTVDGLLAAKNDEMERYMEKVGITEELLFYYMEEISGQEDNIAQIIKEEDERLAEEERKRKEEEERRRREEEERRLAALAAARKAAEEGHPASTKGYDADAINQVVLTDETDMYHMIWPLPGDHRTFSKFGPRNINVKGASTYHRGWDIGGELGAPIVSVLAGTVLSTAYNPSGGNVVSVDHGNGVVSVYCHCSKYLVSPGDYVMQGQRIALVGSTGVSSAPHLHFGIKLNGIYVDPDKYIGHLE